MITKLADIAESQIGKREEGGNNIGPAVREYQGASNLPPGAWPWCAAFVDWCVREWLRDEQARRWLNLQVNTPEQWRPKTAAAFGLIEWAKGKPNSTRILPEGATALRGDIVVFDFSHVGIVLGQPDLDVIETVEGNTNGRGERDSKSGDGVWRKFRDRSLVRNFIRIRPVLNV